MNTEKPQAIENPTNYFTSKTIALLPDLVKDKERQLRAYKISNGMVGKWSGVNDAPEIGAKVNVSMNGIGLATVLGYFIQDGWLGVVVRIAKRPKYFRDEQWNRN